MIFLLVGVALLALKFWDYGPVANWPWWAVLMPFVTTLLWWWYSDASGLNKRREMDRMEERKSERRYGLLERLGIKGRYGRRSKNAKQAERAYAARQHQIDKIEGKRAEQRARNRDSVLRSRFDAEQSITRPSQAGALQEAIAAAKAQQPVRPASARHIGETASSRPMRPDSSAKPSGPADLSSMPYRGFAETVPIEPKSKPKT